MNGRTEVKHAMYEHVEQDWHRLRRLLAPLVITWALLLTSCSGTSLTAPPLTDLHLPGVVKFTNVAEFVQRTGSHSIAELLPYRNDKDGQMHVIFASQHSYNDVTVDGTQLTAVATACTGNLKITVDGHWGICLADQGKNVIIQDFTRHVAEHRATIDTSIISDPVDLIWGPDSRYLALIARAKGSCSINIYDTSPPYSQMLLDTILSLPEFVAESPVGSRCSIGGLSWSPDGAWLAFSASDPLGHFALSARALGLDATAPRVLPVTKVIGISQLVRVHADGYVRGLTWSNTPNVMMYVGNAAQGIEEVNVLTGQQTQILTQRVAEILLLAWTPDGRHLVFVLGLPIGELTPPSPQMYAYTPPAV